MLWKFCSEIFLDYYDSTSFYYVCIMYCLEGMNKIACKTNKTLRPCELYDNIIMFRTYLDINVNFTVIVKVTVNVNVNFECIN